jgi:hypothetical protein
VSQNTPRPWWLLVLVLFLAAALVLALADLGGVADLSYTAG